MALNDDEIPLLSFRSSDACLIRFDRAASPMTEDGKGWMPDAGPPVDGRRCFISALTVYTRHHCLVASLYSASENSAQRAQQTMVRLADNAELIDELLARTRGTLRAASAAVAAAPANSPICQSVLSRLAGLQMAPAKFALYGAKGQLRCASTDFQPPLTLANGSGHVVRIEPDEESLRLILFSEPGTVEALAQFSRTALRELTYLPGTRGDFDLELADGRRDMLLRDDYRAMPSSAWSRMSRRLPRRSSATDPAWRRPLGKRSISADPAAGHDVDCAASSVGGCFTASSCAPWRRSRKRSLPTVPVARRWIFRR